MAGKGGTGSAPVGAWTALINRALGNGSSQRSTLTEGRNAGLRIADRYFRSLWHHQELMLANREATLAHPMDQVPGANLIEEDTWGRPGTYYTWIRLQKRVEGSDEIFDEYGVVDTDHPVTPDEAIAELMNRFADAETPNDTGKGVTILGADTWGFTMVPPLR